MTFSLLHVKMNPSSYRSLQCLHYVRSVWSVTVAILKSIATGCLCVNYSNYGRMVLFL